MLRAAAAAVLLAGLVASAGAPPVARAQDGPRPSVLVFSKTAGFRHDAIPAAVAAVRRATRQAGIDVTATEDASVFSARRLARFDTHGDRGRERLQRPPARPLRHRGLPPDDR